MGAVTAPASRRPAAAGAPLGGAITGGRFLLAAGVVAVLNLVPHGETLLYPLAVLTTWIHEMCHAFVALLLGADVLGLVVRPDTSGLALYAFDPTSFGTVSRAAVASAGYLGAAVVGAGLLSAGRRPRTHRPLLVILGLLVVVSVILWVRTAFAVTTLLAIAAALVVLALGRSATVVRWAVLLVGLQTSLNALLDIRELYLARGGSDAATMSRVVGLPAAFWATSWLLAGGIVVLLAALRTLDGGPGDARAGR